MHKYDEMIQMHVMTVLKTATDQRDWHYLRYNLGLDEETIESLKHLTAHSMSKIVRDSPFFVSIKTEQLRRKMAAAIRVDVLEKETIEAIKNGASRRCLEDMIGLSDNEYTRLKNLAGLGKLERHKPNSLHSDDIELLSIIHANLVKNMQRSNQRIDSLVLMRKLSEATAIPVNSIYIYYYPDVKERFTTFRLSKTELKEAQLQYGQS